MAPPVAFRFLSEALPPHGSRDLDLEDAVIAERPVLGGSGPFAQRVGRYAMLVPAKVRSARELNLAAFGRVRES